MKNITITGNLVARSKKQLSKDVKTEFIRFNVAVNGKNEKDKTIYFRVVAFGFTASIIEQLEKGTRLHVIGDFNPEEWGTEEGKRGINLNITASLVYPILKVELPQISNGPTEVQEGEANSTK